jgi:hypothetical protein
MTSLLTRSSLPWTVSAEGNNARNLQAKDTYTQTYVIIFCAFSGAILLLLLLNAFLRFRRRNEILRQRQALQHAQANPTPLDEKEIEAKKEFIMTLLPIKVRFQNSMTQTAYQEVMISNKYPSRHLQLKTLRIIMNFWKKIKMKLLLLQHVPFVWKLFKSVMNCEGRITPNADMFFILHV